MHNNSAPLVSQVPDFASDQRTEILRMLRKAGATGVSKAILIFEKHFTQCGARIFELEKQGYEIRHESRLGEKYVTFVLVGEPAGPKPQPTYPPKKSAESDYERESRELYDAAMPLFARSKK